MHASPSPSEGATLTVMEAARSAGISRANLLYWIRTGLLPSTKVERQHRIDPADLARAQEVAHLGNVIPAWRKNPKHAGARLRKLREDAGLNQQEFAAAAGLTHEAISHIETGHYVPFPQTLRAIARTLGVEPAFLVSDEPIPVKTWNSDEVAAFLDIPRDRVQRWARTGQVPAKMVSGHWRIPREAVLDIERRGRLRGVSKRLDPRYRG